MRRAQRTITIEGIEVPDRRQQPYRGRIIFVSQETLARLAEWERYDSEFYGGTITLPSDEAAALVQEGLAERETRGGYHGTDKLRDLLTEWGWS